MEFLETLKAFLANNIWEGIVSLATILYFLYKLIRNLTKPKIEKSINPEKLANERDYLKKIIQELQRVQFETQGNKNYFYTEPKAKIKDIDYTPMHIRIKYYINKASKDHEIEESGRTDMSLSDRIRSVRGSTTHNLAKTLYRIKDSVVVILGDPGAGKSFSLRHLAIKIAEQELKRYSHKPILPLYIPLGKYTRTQNESNSPEEVIEFVRRELCERRHYKSFIGDEFEWYLNKGRILFLFDAMDEMPRTDYVERYKKLKDFTRDWPLNKFVFSCRKLDYDETFQAKEIIVKEFEPSQIRHYLSNFFQSKKTAREILTEVRKNKPHIFELASNPFFLTLICHSIKARNSQVIPDNQAQIFDDFFDSFLSREKEKWMYAESAWIGDESIKSAIYKIAFIITNGRGMGTVATEQFISEHFEENGSLENPKQHLDVILEIGKRGRLLIIDEFEKTIQFQHHRFQEYFTAQYLEQRQINVESEYCDDLWWQEVIKMYASITAKPDLLIENILNDTDKIFAEINSDLPYDIRRLILDRVILASACAKLSHEPIKSHLKKRIWDYLTYFKSNGNTVEKVKTIHGLLNFSYGEIKDILTDFLKEESRWIQETAFIEIRSRWSRIKFKVILSIKKTLHFIFFPFPNFSFIDRYFGFFIVFACILALVKLLLKILGFEYIGNAIVVVVPVLVFIVFPVVFIVRYFRIRIGKKRLKRLSSIPEQRLGVQNLFMLVLGSSSPTLRKIVIRALMATDLPEQELISLLPVLAQEINDQKFLDFLWKSVEALEKRQIRKEFQRASDSTIAEKFFKYGKIKICMREYEKAIKNFDKVIELQSENRMAFYCRAVAKTQLQDFSGAIADFTMMIDLEPNFPVPYVARADAKVDANMLSEAIDDYSLALKIAPSFVDAIVKRAALYHHFKKYEQAFYDCNNALELYPRNIAARAMRGELRKIIGSPEALKGAVKDFSNVLKSNPQSVQALLERAEAYIGLRSYKKAISDCTKAIELNPNHIGAYGIRGVAKRENRDHDGAIKDFKGASSILRKILNFRQRA